MLVPAGQWVIAFSTRLANICVSSSRSPGNARDGVAGIQPSVSCRPRRPVDIDLGDHAARPRANRLAAKRALRAPASIWAIRSSASKVALIRSLSCPLRQARIDRQADLLLAPRRLDDHLQAVERRLQIVGDIGTDLFHAFDQCRQPLERRVDLARHARRCRRHCRAAECARRARRRRPRHGVGDAVHPALQAEPEDAAGEGQPRR